MAWFRYIEDRDDSNAMLTGLPCPRCGGNHVHMHLVQVDSGDGRAYAVVAGGFGDPNQVVDYAVVKPVNHGRGTGVALVFSCEDCGGVSDAWAQTFAFHKGTVYVEQVPLLLVDGESGGTGTGELWRD